MIYYLHNGDHFPVYIGKTVRCIGKRLSEHIKSVSKKDRKYYGVSKWIIQQENIFLEVLDSCSGNENFWEQHYIGLYKSWGFNLLNKTQGGDGGLMDLETRNRISKKLTGVKMPEYIKEKISNSLKGVPKKDKSNYTSSHTKRICVYDGIQYRSTNEAAIANNITRQTVWKQIKFGKKDRSIIIGGVKYPSLRKAAIELKTSRNKIKDTLKSNNVNDLHTTKYKRRSVVLKGKSFASIKEAANGFNVDRSTIYEWLKRTA